MRQVRIGNGAGFWGDWLEAPRRLAMAPDARLDYLTLEYLAELTLSILAHQRARDPSAGFVSDLPTVIESLLPALAAPPPHAGSPGLRIVTNGGGMNPAACCTALGRLLAEHGMGRLLVACVAGDDLLPRLDELSRHGVSFEHFDDGTPLPVPPAQLASANVYLGAQGIVAALERDARIVVTGRVADASLTVGPAVHEFGWSWTDWNRLAAATVAGHLIECGAQVTGGMCSAWDPGWRLADVGYPIVEIDASGEFAVTKPAGTGGRVSFETVSEQLVYEIGDPAAYATPDAVADFSHVVLREQGSDRVAVSGARGHPAPPTLKASLSFRDGYLAVGTLAVAGPDALARGKATAEILRERLAGDGLRFREWRVDCIGDAAVVPGITFTHGRQNETWLRIAVHADDRVSAERFTRAFTPLVANGPPGVTGYTGPRTKPWPVFAYWPARVPRGLVEATVEVRTAADWS